MIVDLKPYPQRKDSGVVWLGEVPGHWEVRRLKWIASLNPSKTESGITLSGDTQVTFLPMERVGVGGSVNAREVVAARAVWNGFTYFRRNDILIAKITRCFENGKGAWLRTLPTEVGFGSTEFHVLRAKAGALPAFLYRLTTVAEFRRLGAGAMTGSAGQQRVPAAFVANAPVAFPPLPEQTAIVRYLDHLDRRIRRYIRAKQKLIALLEEQKQAIIHRAVTRGLYPKVRLKPSGVEWLGEVPAHWETVRLKFVATQIVDCLHATPVYSETGDYPAIRTADVQPGQLLVESARHVDEEHYLRWTARMTPAEGDIVYTREGERFGIAALVPAGVRVCISQRMMVFRIPPMHNSAYVMWQINRRHVYAQAAADLIGAAAPHVNVERIRNLWMVLPPKSEQDEIIATIGRGHSGPNAAIVKAQREISLLREYRTRLIADVVTGKLDVREAAASLPDEVEEPLQEAEGLAEDEEGEMEETEAEEVEG